MMSNQIDQMKLCWLTPSVSRRLPRRFTQNLSVFRREVNDSMKNSTYGVNSNDMMS